ncbi:hypothetical protein D3C73_1112420 [compost metagenome]
MHAADRLDQLGTSGGAALMRLAGGIECCMAECRSGLFGGDHHLGVADNLRGGPKLRLQLFRQLPNRVGHTGGRQRVVAGGVGKIPSQLGHRAGLVDRHGVGNGAGTQARQPDHQHRQGQAQVKRPSAEGHATHQHHQGDALQGWRQPEVFRQQGGRLPCPDHRSFASHLHHPHF